MNTDMRNLPLFSPHRAPNIPVNPWQHGIMQMLGKIHPREFQLLWIIAELADERGVSDAGMTYVTHRSGLSKFNATKWLRILRKQGWYTLHTTVVPVKNIPVHRAGHFLKRRAHTTKILHPNIRKGLPVPEWEWPVSKLSTTIQRSFRSCTRIKHYVHLIRYNRELQVWARRTDMKNRQKKRARKNPPVKGGRSKSVRHCRT